MSDKNAVVIISATKDVFLLHGYMYNDNEKQVKVDIDISYTNKGYRSKDEVENDEHMRYVEPTLFFNYMELRTKESLSKAIKKIESVEDINIGYIYASITETDKFLFEKSEFHKEHFLSNDNNTLVVYDEYKKNDSLNLQVLEVFDYLDKKIEFETGEDDNFNIFNTFKHRNVWKYKVKRPDLLMHSKVILSKEPNIYYQTNIKEISKIGTKSSESPYAVCKLNQPVDVIDELREVVDFNYSTVIHLPMIFKSFPTYILGAFKSTGIGFTHVNRSRIKVKNKREKLVNVGSLSVVPKKRTKIIYRISDIDIAENIYPMNLTYRSREIFRYLHDLMDKADKGTLSIPHRDITHLFYDGGVLVEGITQKTLSVNVEIKEAKKKKNAKLMLGTSVPSRNVLKRLEKKNPKIELIVDIDNEHRYCTLLTCDEGSIIMSDFYCDVMLGF